MKAVRGLGFAGGLLGVLVGTAWASLGGPLTVNVLGWDAASSRIYVEQVGHDESGERNCTFYYDLRSPEPARPHVVPASRLDLPPDTTGLARARLAFQRTISRLRPLPREDEGRTSILDGTRIVERSVFERQGDKFDRFLLELGRLEGASELDTIRVTAYREPRVQVLRQYRIPGRNERLVVLSYRGMPFESVYEVQQCVVLRTARGGMQRLDSDHGVLK